LIYSETSFNTTYIFFFKVIGKPLISIKLTVPKNLPMNFG
jgi:hypothetical protein